MTLSLLSEHHLKFLRLKGGCTGSSGSIHVKMQHCWKSHVRAHLKKVFVSAPVYSAGQFFTTSVPVNETVY